MSAVPSTTSAASDNANERDRRDAEDCHSAEHHRPGAPLQRMVREPRRGRERADGRRRAQQSQPPRPGMQDVACVYWKECCRAAEQHREKIQRDRAEERALAANEGNAGEQRRQRGRIAMRGLALDAQACAESARHQKQHRAQGIDRRGSGDVEQTSQRGPEDDRRLPCGRVRRHRTRQQPRWNKRWQERLLRRHLESTRGADHRDQCEDRMLVDTAARA